MSKLRVIQVASDAEHVTYQVLREPERLLVTTAAVAASDETDGLIAIIARLSGESIRSLRGDA